MELVAAAWEDNILWRILEMPIGWRLWVLWLMVVNTACVFFLKERVARVVLAVWIGNVITMSAMYWMFGFVRLLGLSHVIWWTPLFIWLIPWMLRQKPTGALATWLWLLIASDLASLVIDYVDVVRYLMGDTSEV